MLCLKKKKFWGSSSSYGPQNQTKNYDQGAGGTSSEDRCSNRDQSRARDMAPPPTSAPAIHPVVREVTEDTPPDLLEGTMDLKVILPSGAAVQSTVERKTPMMDLLIHITTANKINPAGHIVQVRNERGIEMPYKPSTPIGALDTTTIEIVPKNRVNEYIIVKKPTKVANQPFETTFRLQVHLPRNQLYVMRISPKTRLDEILREVCQEKNLDISKYEIRHPVNLDQKLSLSMSVGEAGLQELTVVSKNSKINSSVSAADIIALQQSDENRGKGCLDGSFKHSRSSVGDSSVSSESTGSGRGISPCRSEDSRSISPLPLIRPKTLIHSRPSYVSTCSSTGNSSGLLKSNSLDPSALSPISHQPVTMQAPPRTKKRAAPQPPSTPGAKVNTSNGCTPSSNVCSPLTEQYPSCSTPISSSNLKSGADSLERVPPRKKEAPREPPKIHTPLSHHQSLPLNHMRHNLGSNATADCQQQELGRDDHNDSSHAERSNHSVIAKMSSRHSISSSMTNLTSVSSVSSTSLASSTGGGGSKKRRAPKPPALAAVHPPTQIDEETTATDGETSSRAGSDYNSHQTVDEEKVAHRLEQQSTTESMPVARVPDIKKIEVLSASPVSSLSSPSHSASESTSSSPIPPTSAEFSSKSNSLVMRERSLNTNYNGDGNGLGDPLTSQENVERGSNIINFSRSSSSPSSSNNNAIAAASAPSPDSVRSRKALSSIAVDDAQSVVEDTSSCRPPSSNTQVTSSSPASRAMPMPLPRRRAPTAPENASNKVPNKQTEETEQAVVSQSQPKPTAQTLPKPKPKPRSDRVSVESMISKTSTIIKPQTRSDFNTRQSTESSDDSVESETTRVPTTLSGQLRNPLAKYGVKVLPDNVVKEREDRLLRYDAQAQSTEGLEGAPNQANNSHKVPIRASKSSSSDTTENFSDTGSVTSFSNLPIKKLGNSGLPSKPAPTLSKSDYTSQGSVRSIKQLASVSSKSVETGNDDESRYDSDNLEENLDFFEPSNDDDSSLTKSVSSQRAAPIGKENVVTVKPTKRDETPKPRVCSSVSAYEDIEKESSSASPGTASESGFTRTSSQREFKKATTAEDASKLNRWQNMVSLNEIEKTKEAGSSNMSPSRSKNTNKPVVASAAVLTGSVGSSKQNTTPLHDDFQRNKKRLTVEENQTDAMCHSSESEASYTDSGVPATETVTPSPVNLDDVIPDHEYHAGTHQEKFSSEDAEELRNSSRRSSLHSDHSEEWMNILEAKMNKDEEAIEKMFEAVLPKTGVEENGFDSPTLVGDVAKKETETSSDEHENDDIAEDETRSKVANEIETTVELHHPPASIPKEIEDSQMGSQSVPATAVPVRKISKSESFSHNSEYDEAKQRRKNFYSARSNAVNGNSQSTGSVTDLRQSSSSSEEEGELSPIHSLAKNANSLNRTSNKAAANSLHQHNHVRDDRAVSMNDLSAENYIRDPAGKKVETIKTKTSSTDLKSVQKSTSLQKLSSGDTLDEAVAMDMFRKQLEMQFEQWKEEFLKKHVKSDENDDDMEDEVETIQQVEQTSAFEVSKPEIEKAEPGAIEQEKIQQSLTLPQITLAVGTEAESDDTSSHLDSKPGLKSELIQDPPKEEPVLTNEVSDVTNSSVNKEESDELKMKDTEAFQAVELRKKKEAPQVIYQYSGPPTIKMASWNERPRRAVSVKKDEDYIMGFGQQDPNAKSSNPARIHSFHGGPVVSMAQLQTDNDHVSGKNNRESSPTPTVHVKGWSAALNATNVTPNSTGAVRSVLSAWKQKMEETEKEKSKPKEGPPAEIDIYGSENTEKVQPTPAPIKSTPEPVKIVESTNKTVQRVSESQIEKQTKPVVVEVKAATTTTKPEPKVVEKSKTLGSSFRSEKPMVFSQSSMDSNSNTLPKTRPVTIHNPSDVVDYKSNPATSTVEITSGSTLQERKKFFQGIQPVQNGKEAPIPATNLKSNIAAIQKVFEKQRTTKIQQMGSQQSLYSEGTISPVSSLQRNDSMESRKSNNNNNFQRQNSIESHASDSSSVVLRVSGKASPQLSSTEMVQKLFGRPNNFNLDTSRRTPSPISSTTSTLSSSTSYERFTPSPTVVDGPNNSVRITTGGYKPPKMQPSSTTTPAIRSVGNKAIIMVNGAEGSKTANKPEKTSAANDIILHEKNSSNSAKRPSVTSTYMSAIVQQQQLSKLAPAPAKQVPVTTKKMSIESVSSQKSANSNGIPPPPPPPSDSPTTPSLNLEKLKTTPVANNSRSSKPLTPTTPTSPRDEIFNAIKNSNGNFGLKKTGSSILLK